MPIKNRLAYISGPISMYIDTHKNKPAFEEAEARFNNIGFRSVNPHKLHTPEEEKTLHWADFMIKDVTELLKCGIIVMLPDWEKSSGAIVEYFNARIHGIPAVDSTTYEPVILTTESLFQLSQKINVMVCKSDLEFIHKKSVAEQFSV